MWYCIGKVSWTSLYVSIHTYVVLYREGIMDQFVCSYMWYCVGNPCGIMDQFVSIHMWYCIGNPCGTMVQFVCTIRMWYCIGNPCGIMDQFVAVLGEEGCALMIDCSNQTYRSIPFNNPNLAVLVINSGVRHELAGGEYKKRRESCEAAASALMVSSLQSVSMEQLENGNGLFCVCMCVCLQLFIDPI